MTQGVSVDNASFNIPGTIRDAVSGITMTVNADGSINTSGGGGTGSGSTSSNLVQVAGLAVGTGHGTASGVLRVELPTDGTGVVGLSAGSAVIGHVINDTSSNVIGHVVLDTSSSVVGHVIVDANASAVIGKVAVDQTTPGTTNAVQTIPGTSGGTLTSSNIIANNTTAIVVKASPGQVYGYEAFNNSATIAYLKVYDTTSLTAGVGTPAARHMIPGATSGGAGFTIVSANGRTYSTGITLVVTTGIADNDVGIPAASTYIVNVHYK